MTTFVANGSIYDNFTPVATGTNLNGRTTDSGHTWSAIRGVWAVQTGNSLGNVAGTSSGGEVCVLTTDFGTADVDIEATLELQNVRNPWGVCLRHHETGGIGGYWAGSNGSAYGGLEAYAWDGSNWVYTTVASFSDVGNGDIKDGDVVRVVASGSSITCYRNGTQVATATDSTHSSTTHGLWQRFSGATSSGRFYAFNMHPSTSRGLVVGYMTLN